MIDIDKCRITHYPSVVLASKAQPVEKIDDNIRRLVDKMYEIMIENKGVGLAAPGIGHRLLPFRGIYAGDHPPGRLCLALAGYF